MRSLLTLVSIAVLGMSTQAGAQTPMLAPPPLVSPAEPHAAPRVVGGLRESMAPELTCIACAAAEAVGITGFVFAYASSVGLWLHSEDVLGHPTTGAWVAAIFVPIAQGMALSELIPVLGPILGATFFFGNEPAQVKWAWIDAGVQAASLLLAGTGAIAQNQWQKSHRLTVVPLLQPGASGLALGGTF